MVNKVLIDNRDNSIHKAADLLLGDLSYASKHKGAIRWLRDLVEKGQLKYVYNHIKRHNLLHLAAVESWMYPSASERYSEYLAKGHRTWSAFSNSKQKMGCCRSPYCLHASYRRPIIRQYFSS
jgi:hypothetical protein